MRNFVFKKSSTDWVTMPVDSFSHSEYTSATSLTLYFACYKLGKTATVSVVLAVTSGKGGAVSESIMNQIGSGSSASLKYDDISSTYFTADVTGVTSITTDVEPTITGADGTDGTNGLGVPSGGATSEILRKVSATDNDTEWSGKTFDYINCNFYDDLGTTKHYLPLGGPPSEQTTNISTYTSFLMPCDGKVLSVELRLPDTVLSGGNITMSVEKTAIGSDLSAETIVESETLAVNSTSDEEIAHFLFDNAAVSAGETLFVAIQNDTDLSIAQNWIATVVVEFDWSTRFTQSSVIITS